MRITSTFSHLFSDSSASFVACRVRCVCASRANKIFNESSECHFNVYEYIFRAYLLAYLCVLLEKVANRSQSKYEMYNTMTAKEEKT